MAVLVCRYRDDWRGLMPPLRSTGLRVQDARCQVLQLLKVMTNMMLAMMIWHSHN
jgi:hypothetical protein